MTPEILCVGHAAYDLSVFVDEFPTEDSKRETNDLREECGGPAANAAFLLSSWRAPAAFAGLVGDDVYGARVLEDFARVGTDVSLTETRRGHVTPLSIILVNQRNGSRTVINRKAPAALFELNANSLSGWSPKILLFDGHELAAAESALRLFPDAISILDAGSWRDGTATLAGQVNWLASSKRFASQATGCIDFATGAARHRCTRQLHHKFSRPVIVTFGEHGLIADDGGDIIEIPALKSACVDSTAAGDIFHGALAFGIWQGWKLRESLRFATVAAGLSVRERGGRRSIPSLASVKEALAHAG